MSVNTRVIDNENNRTLYIGDELEGQLAAEQVALGNAEALAEPAPPAPSAEEVAASQEVVATQAAIDHAEAMGIDLATIQGSGKDGKVTKADVEAAIAAKG